MRNCPCCDRNKPLTYASGLRVGVYVCTSCGEMEHLRGNKPWAVDKKPVPELVRAFIDLRGKHLQNGGSSYPANPAQANSIQMQYMQLLHQLWGLSIVTLIKGHVHTALASFDDPADAVAFALGRLVQGSSLSAPNMWILPDGSMLYILILDQ